VDLGTLQVCFVNQLVEFQADVAVTMDTTRSTGYTASLV
jgi:hypothetical protein